MERHTKLTIATLMLAGFMIGTDFIGSVLLVASLEKAFSADITTTQWVLNIYALTYAVFMVAAGRLGDMYGRRNLMLLGLVIFFLASVSCVLSPSISWLIGSRAVQGVGAALLWPSILALGVTSVGDDKRGLVMGLLLAGVTAGNVAGPLLGGFVSWLGDWRIFFMVNAAMAMLVALLVFLILAKDAPMVSGGRVDIGGMVILGLALFSLLYALDVGSDWGWSSLAVLSLLVLSALMFILFPMFEARVTDPMMPVSMMKNREFMLTLSTNGLVVPAIFIAFLYFPQYMQKTLGWSVLESSFGMMPLMVVLSVGSVLGGSLYAPIGPKRLLFAGYVLVCLGAAWTIFMLEPSWGYFAILPAMLLMSSGAILCVGSAGTAAVSAVPPSRAGLAGGLSFMVHLIFGALGVAGATAIMSAQIYAVGETGLSDAFANGMSGAFWLALMTAIAGVIVVLAIDERKLLTVQEP